MTSSEQDLQWQLAEWKSIAKRNHRECIAEMKRLHNMLVASATARQLIQQAIRNAIMRIEDYLLTKDENELKKAQDCLLQVRQR